MPNTHDIVAPRRGGALRWAILAAGFTAVGTLPCLAEGRIAHDGTASFYGREEHGGRTASGERFNMNAMTAAHRTAPLGSHLKVTNLRNGRSVVVRINDRGPFVRGRIIDLSRAAAGELGFIGAGVTRVHVETADAGTPDGPTVAEAKTSSEPATTGSIAKTNAPPEAHPGETPPIVLAERERLMIERGQRSN